MLCSEMLVQNLNLYFRSDANSQTGEVAGKVPVSTVKKTGFFFIVLAIAAAIARLILGIFMRGIWG